MVIPGIGGTRLVDARGHTAYEGTPADLLDPKRIAALVDDKPLTPRGLLRDWRVCRFWTPLHGYEQLLTCARIASGSGPSEVDDGTGEPNLDATVVGFGYDFRLGVRPASEQLARDLSRRVERLWPKTAQRRGRVVLLGHSMGGLVARHLVATSSLASCIRAVVTLGTPHRGAPKAVEVMANGYPVRVLGVRVGHVQSFAPIARSWPGMSDLLPQYPVVPQPETSVPSPRLVRPVESDLEWLAQAARWGTVTHKEIRDGWRGLDEPPEVVPRLGFGHATLRAVTRRGNNLSVGTGAGDLATPEGTYWDNDLGDGTVPATSAVPLELGQHRPRDFRVAARHGGLVTMDVTEILRSFRSAPPVPSVYMAEDKPYDTSIGLDLDELVSAASPINVTATVWQRLGQSVSKRCENLPRELTVQVVPHAPGEPVGRVILSRREDGVFEGTIPPLKAGLFDVQLHASALRHEPVHQLIDVFDG
ncbi:MAG TPA: hypothetical protein PLX68_03220 [Dermatophilaceae bacterium]|nr:hypothetical protein [Dermatophilaceae bacterium]